MNSAYLSDQISVLCSPVLPFYGYFSFSLQITYSIPDLLFVFIPFWDNAFAGCISAKFSCLWSYLKSISTLWLFPIVWTAQTPLSFLIPTWDVGYEVWRRLEGRNMGLREETARRAEGSVLETSVKDTWGVTVQWSVLDHRPRPSTSVIPHTKELNEDKNARAMFYQFCLELDEVLNI